MLAKRPLASLFVGHEEGDFPLEEAFTFNFLLALEYFEDHIEVFDAHLGAF